MDLAGRQPQVLVLVGQAGDVALQVLVVAQHVLLGLGLDDEPQPGRQGFAGDGIDLRLLLDGFAGDGVDLLGLLDLLHLELEGPRLVVVVEEYVAHGDLILVLLALVQQDQQFAVQGLVLGGIHVHLLLLGFLVAGRGRRAGLEGGRRGGLDGIALDGGASTIRAASGGAGRAAGAGAAGAARGDDAEGGGPGAGVVPLAGDGHGGRAGGGVAGIAQRVVGVLRQRLGAQLGRVVADGHVRRERRAGGLLRLDGAHDHVAGADGLRGDGEGAVGHLDLVVGGVGHGQRAGGVLIGTDGLAGLASQLAGDGDGRGLVEHAADGAGEGRVVRAPDLALPGLGRDGDGLLGDGAGDGLDGACGQRVGVLVAAREAQMTVKVHGHGAGPGVLAVELEGL